MPKLPRVSARELIAALRRDGWMTVRQSGSHVQLKHAAKPGKVTVPIHGSQTLPVDLVSAILKQASLTADEPRDLLYEVAMHRYTIVITPDSEDGRYVVTVPALPGCFTYGNTVEEAIEYAKDAIELHIAGLIQEGDPVPVESEAAQLAMVEVA